MTSETTLLCAICGDTAADERLVSECMSCSRTFHLNPYNNDDHKDCGDALIGPTQGVEFWCQICLEELNAEINASAPDPRAMLEGLAGPPELRAAVQHDQGERAAAGETNAPASGRATAPPPRRNREQPRKRYRRIDG